MEEGTLSVVAPPAPASEDVHIVVLGRGTGESVLVHLGGGEWVIIDSFLGRWGIDGEMRPAPLAYLDAIGVDVGHQVSSVVLSHLHADHCEGIDEVVERCEEARFHLPAALPDVRWDEILKVATPDAPPDRTKRMRAIGSAFRYADGNFRPLGATSSLGRRRPILHALAPGWSAQLRVRAPFKQWTFGSAARLLKENATSIVLWLDAGPAVALLTADLDKHRTFGWQALLAEHEHLEWVRGAGFVKVPHHGSRGAHLPAVYEHLTDEPLAVVTPNHYGGHRLPELGEIDELKGSVRELWLAGPSDAVGGSVPDREEIVWITSSCDESGKWAVVGRHEDAPRL